MADQIIEVPGMGRVAFPAGMSDTDIAAAIQKNMPTLPPSNRSVVGNSAAKAVAGFGDMVGSGMVNAYNLNLAALGTGAHLFGAKGSDMPDLIPSDALSGWEKMGRAGGMIKDENNPQTMGQRALDVGTQVLAKNERPPGSAGEAVEV